MTALAAPIVACHACGCVHVQSHLPRGSKAVCTRCGTVFYERHDHGIERALALNTTALVLFLIANFWPFLTFEMEGREQPTNLVSSVIALYQDGYWPLAALVGAVAIGMPFLRITTSLVVLTCLTLGWRPPFLKTFVRIVEGTRPWAMTEVYLLGAIVAYVKLADMATIILGVGLWAFIALILIQILAELSYEPHFLWTMLEPQADASILPDRPGTTLVACHACGQVARLPDGAHDAACTRCGAAMHKRKVDSLNRTWAFLIAAILLYVPANVYPVLTLVYFGAGQPSTILGGVEELAGAGMWPLAALVFFASITVPVLKIIGLIYLLLSVQFGWTKGLRDRTRLYAIVETVGRWSMIDVFMIGILSAMVQLGAIATIHPGIGAVCFGAVVVLTMIAAEAFDPRLIWDNAGATTDADKRALRV